MRPYYPDTTPPLWPSGSKLSAFHISPTSLTLKWAVATDDAGVVTYRIFEGKNPIANVTGSLSSYNVTDIHPGTTHTFKVEAGDRADNWSNSGPALTVTMPVPPL